MNVKNIFLVIVSVMLLAPSLLFFANTNEDGTQENLAPLEFNKKKPFEMFDNYYKYNFAFRKMLSKQYISLKSNLVKVSSLPDKVINGKDGWYFLGNSYNNVYAASLGVHRYNEKGINAITGDIIEMKRFCDSLGIKFYCFPAPNSHTVYKEFLPVKANNVPREFDMVKARLVQAGVNVIDAREALIAGKKDNQIYYKTDSHWNQLGAFIGADVILKTMQKDFSKIVLPNKNDYTIKSVVSRQMDLTMMLGSFVDETVYEFQEKGESPITIKYDTIDRYQVAYMKNPTKSYKGFMYRDSYGVTLIPFLHHTFGDMTYFWTSSFNKRAIIDGKPDFVLYEIVERNLLMTDIK
jgi:alginate O-acetyltransferase complex protein AlgJ